MTPGLRILHLLVALLSILVTIYMALREVTETGLRFEIRIERLHQPMTPERQTRVASDHSRRVK